MKYLQDVIDNLKPLSEMGMPPQDKRKWLEDMLQDATEYGDISSEAMDDVWDNDKLMWKMADAFVDLVDKIPANLPREKTDDAIYDKALEVYHQHVGPIKSKEKVDESKKITEAPAEQTDKLADWIFQDSDENDLRDWIKRALIEMKPEEYNRWLKMAEKYKWK